ncbi:hypothetical protein CBM2599_A120187 [Cupriavidus taiwanensis]|nr:hypothetical protein CBM2599_A120187 [Cupriavidus taiwanensis]SOY81595.1 hypothetical protein CBM2600_A120213 [Cupriavidus taiwanensis]
MKSPRIRETFLSAHCNIVPTLALSDIGQTRVGWSPRVNAAPG